MLITMKYRRLWKTTESSKFMDLWAIYISGFSSQRFIYKYRFITFEPFSKLPFSNKNYERSYSQTVATEGSRHRKRATGQNEYRIL